MVDFRAVAVGGAHACVLLGDDDGNTYVSPLNALARVLCLLVSWSPGLLVSWCVSAQLALRSQLALLLLLNDA